MTAAALSPAKSIAIAATAVALEGYDLSIYGIFALAIAGAFFPSGDATISLLLAVATLGVGYVVRPLGGLVLGVYADRAGRKAAIALTVILMSISTGVIGFVPSASTIGVAAPIIVVCARLVQGFAAGGATAGSIAFLIETAPAGRRGFYASWQQASQVGAFLLSVAIGAAISNLLPASTGQWAWRLPFVFAFLLGPLGLYIKRYLPDPEVFEAVRDAAATATVRDALSTSRWAVLSGFGLSCLWNISAFILLFYMPTWLQKQIGLPAGRAFLSSTAAAALLFVLCPLVGAWSDRVGRKLPMLLGAAGLCGMTWPLLTWIETERTVSVALLAQLALALLIALYTAPVSAMLAEQFPTRNRSTGLSVAYNLSTLLVGAFGPLIVTSLIALTGSAVAPAFYVVGGAAISLMTLLLVPDRSREPLTAI